MLAVIFPILVGPVCLFFTVSLLLFTKHIAMLYSYLSICFLGVYSVIFWVQIQNSTEHD